MNARKVLIERIEKAQSHEAALPGVDAVHDMRVALRRLRAALRLLDLRDELDAPVKRLQDSLGAVRDIQLHGEAIGARAKAMLRRREAALRPALAEWNAKTLPALLDAARKAKAPHRKRRYAVLRKRLKRFSERLEAALAHPSPRAMHLVRISAKQVRYLFELEDTKVSKRLLAELPPLQESLGQLHDLDVRAKLTRGAPGEARAQLEAIVKTQLERWQERSIASNARDAL